MNEKRARKLEPAVRAMLSNYCDAVLSKAGVHLIRGRDVAYLNDDEMDRLATEWIRYRVETAPGQRVRGQ